MYPTADVPYYDSVRIPVAEDPWREGNRVVGRRLSFDEEFTISSRTGMTNRGRSLVEDLGTARVQGIQDFGFQVIEGIRRRNISGMFFQEFAPERAHWSLAKWDKMTGIPSLAAEDANEHGLFVWESATARIIELNGLTYQTFERLIRGKLPAFWENDINEIGLTPPESLADFCDLLAETQQFGQGHVALLEKKVINLNSPFSTVAESQQTLLALLDEYKRLAIRHRRHNAIHSHMIAEIIMRILPTRVAEHLERKGIKYLPYADIMAKAREVEADVKESTLAFAAEPVRREGERYCRGCQGPHYFKDCEDRDVRCFRCHEIGHRAARCRSLIYCDKMGQKRIIMTENAKGANTKILTDNTAEKQLETAKAAVSGQLKRFENAKARQRQVRNYRNENNEMEEKTIRKPRQVLVAEKEKIEKEEEESAEEIESEEEKFACAAQLASHWTRRSEIKTIEARIHGQAARLCLDDGSEINVMAEEERKRLNIPEKNGKECIIRGVGGQIKCKETQPIEIQIGNTKFTEKFLIHPEHVPTLLSFPAQRRLQTITDLGSMTIQVNGTTVPICLQTTTLEEDEEIEKKIAHLEPHCPRKQFNELISFLKNNKASLFEDPTGLAKVKPVEIRVKPSHEPKRANPRPLSPASMDIATSILENMGKNALIERVPSCTNVSPIHLVLRPNKKPRMVIDYRYLNTGLADDAHPIPHMLTLQERLAQYELFTTVDLRWGFHNIPLKSDSMDLTGFCVPGKGVFRFRVLPFGLKVAPTIFQAIMEEVLFEELCGGYTFIYIDDIAIGANSYQQLVARTLHLLKKLQQNGFCINFSKTHIGVREVKYLGFLISNRGLNVDPQKVADLQKCGRPNTRKELVSFLATARYLSSHIPHFALLEKTLHRKTLEKGKFVWTTEDHQDFVELKKRIGEAVALRAVDTSLPFLLFVDASDIGVGAALAQRNPETKELKYIKFAAHRLNSVQEKWDTTDREIFALMWGLEVCETYIKGAEVTVLTDHKALQFLENAAKPKLIRYALRIAEFHPKIEHIGGEDNCVADWLSRAVRDFSPEEPRVGYSFAVGHSRPEEYKMPTMRKIFEAAREEGPDLPPKVRLTQDTAYHEDTRKIYVPRIYRQSLLLMVHGAKYSGHVGGKKMRIMLQRSFWWPSLSKDCEEWARSCPLCAALRPQSTGIKPRGNLQAMTLGDAVSIDYVGPRSWFNKKVYFLTVVDHYSRMLCAAVTEKPTGPFALDVLHVKWKPFMGTPRILISDNQPFSTEFTKLAESSLGCKHYRTYPYHPQGNGINESAHRLLEHAVATATQTGMSSIELVLQEAVYAYNATPHEGTGESPHFLAYGQDMRVPNMDLIQRTHEENTRLHTLNYDRFLRFAYYLMRKELEAESPQPQLEMGMTVVYKLPEGNAPKTLRHVSGVTSWHPKYSLPHKITGISKSGCTLTPLWNTTRAGGEVIRPQSEVKVIASRIPPPLRLQAERLIEIHEAQREKETAPTVPTEARVSIHDAQVAIWSDNGDRQDKEHDDD